MRSAAALLLFLPALAAAQVRENVTVEVIEVPVHVTAPGGEPVRGLTRDAFELRVNGRVVPIDYFDAVDLPAPSTDAAQPKPAAAPLPPRERRLYLLLFDTVYSNLSKLPRALRAAEAAVARSNAATDLFAVATYTGSRGIEFVTPFLADRAVTLRALRTLTISRTADPLGLAMSADDRAQWVGATSEGDADEVEIGKKVDDAGVAALAAIGEEEMKSEAQRHIEYLFDNFATVATRLSHLEGQKHVLWFSSGYSSKLVHGGQGSLGRPPAAGGGLARSNRLLQDMAHAFEAAGVVVDAIDIDGVRVGTSDAAESLVMVAQYTGGDVVHNRNDLARALTDLTAAQRVVYILGFNRGKLRGGTISVRVNGVPAGTRLTYRTGFGAAAEKKDVDALQLIDILINDVPQHDINARLAVVDSKVALELHPAEFPEGAKEVDALLYVFNADGAAVTGYGKRIPVVSKAPIVLRHPLDLPPGRYVAKVVVRIAGTAYVGFARTEFTRAP